MRDHSANDTDAKWPPERPNLHSDDWLCQKEAIHFTRLSASTLKRRRRLIAVNVAGRWWYSIARMVNFDTLEQD